MLETPPRSLRSSICAACLLLILSIIAACEQAPAPSSPPRPVPAEPQLTFNKDIAPILYENCAVCHRPVEPRTVRRTAEGKSLDPVCVAGAPFSLLSYEDARDHAAEIVEATGTRAMPPWLPEPGHGDFAHHRRLADGQIATIARWAEQGTVEGDAD